MTKAARASTRDANLQEHDLVTGRNPRRFRQPRGERIRRAVSRCARSSTSTTSSSGITGGSSGWCAPAEADCTVPQVAAITGHSLKQGEGIIETEFVRTYAALFGGPPHPPRYPSNSADSTTARPLRNVQRQPSISVAGLSLR